MSEPKPEPVIRRLRTSARQLANGDLAVRVGAAVQNRRDEMGDLGRDFDFMAERSRVQEDEPGFRRQ